MMYRTYMPMKADKTVAWGLLFWWLLNVLQAAFTELAHDEAYYYMFAQNLDWGYFDHPPMTALLIWLGNGIGGELGVRLFFTLLQPLYLWVLWYLIRPREPQRHDAVNFLLISAALPILQLYGFIAVPDVPLLMTAALFFVCYKRFTEDESILNMLLLGFTMALMAYSKYHGALVVIFTLVTNPRLFTRSRIYVSGLFTLMLITPHLLWQQSHDWASFAYHLHDRNGAFAFSNIVEHLLNTIAVFNPFFFPVYFLAWKRVRTHNATERALFWLPILFFVFFTVSTFKGRVQPQWLIVAVFGLIYILFHYMREYVSPKMLRYLRTVAWVTIALAALARVELIWNPLGMQHEVFNNRDSFEAIGEVAGDRAIIFGGSYAVASKYNFYTGKPAYCQPDFNYRTSQWQFRDDDTRAAGKPVLWGVLADGVQPVPGGHKGLSLANGKKFIYAEIDDFRPVRRVDVHFNPELMPSTLSPGDTLTCVLGFTNPYPDTVDIGRDNTQLYMLFKAKKMRRVVSVDFEEVLPPSTATETTSIHARVQVVVPNDLPARVYDAGFAVGRAPLCFWYNSPRCRIEITADK